MRVKRLIASIAGLAMAGGFSLGFASPAFATIGDNVHPLISNSGAVNCRGGDTCVEKVGDTAEVSWIVQTTPIVKSSDDSQNPPLGMIAVPKVVENLKLETVSIPDEKAQLELNQKQSNYHQYPDGPVKMISQDVRLVTGDRTFASEISSHERDESGELVETDPSSWAARLYKPVWTVEIDEKTQKKHEYYVDAPSMEWSTKNFDLYNFIELGPGDLGVYTFKLSGTVEVKSEDTYLPIRVFNTTWHCLLNVCDSLQTYPWARTGDLPEYSLTDPEVNARIATLQTTRTDTDGRLGTSQCSPTSEIYDRNDILGWDKEQPIPAMKNVAEKYTETFNLHLNPAVTYSVSGYNVPEDGCDQADFHITICDSEEPEPKPEPTPTPTPKPTPTPEPKPTPTTKPVEPTPDKPVEPTPDKPQASQNVSASSQQLPRTGADLSGLAVVGTLFAGVGVLALGMRRRAIK